MNSVPAVQNNADVMASVILKGDLSRLAPEEKVKYYTAVCRSLGLNPLTQPFAYMNLSGKHILYAKRDATDQLRSLHNVSVEDMSEVVREGVYIVTCKVRDGKGRADVSKGAVSITGLKGEALANAMMKAETKAKRRATLSIVGLGMLDETETDSIPDAVEMPIEPIDFDTGEIHHEDADAVVLQDLDDGLAMAATRGTDALKEAWNFIDTKHREALKPALDEKHKPVAREVDIQRARTQGTTQ